MAHPEDPVALAGSPADRRTPEASTPVPARPEPVRRPFLALALLAWLAGLPLLMAAATFLATPVLALLEPARAYIPRRTSSWGLAAAVIGGGTSVDQPTFSMLRYEYDPDRPHHAWVSTDHRPGAWTDQFFPASGTVASTSPRRWGWLPLVRVVTSASAPAIVVPFAQARLMAGPTASGTWVCSPLGA